MKKNHGQLYIQNPQQQIILGTSGLTTSNTISLGTAGGTVNGLYLIDPEEIEFIKELRNKKLYKMIKE